MVCARVLQACLGVEITNLPLRYLHQLLSCQLHIGFVLAQIPMGEPTLVSVA